MKQQGRLLAAGLALLLACAAAAQERPAAAPAGEATLVPYKVQVVFHEYEGETRVSSLPYTLTVNAGSQDYGSVRMGLKVPIMTSSTQLQYMDVGTNIDAYPNPDGKRLRVTFERTSLYPPEGERQRSRAQLPPPPPPPHAGPLPEGGTAPVVRHFQGRVELLFRDGAGAEATVATDPVSGRVLMVEVRLTQVK